METTIVYSVLIGSLSLVILHIVFSINYFQRFVFEYVWNKSTTWNPNHDRAALFFSVFFGFITVYLMLEIWSGKTENSWFLTNSYLVFIALFTIFIIVFIRNITGTNSTAVGSKQKVQNDTYINTFEDNSEEIFRFVMERNFFDRNTLLDDFEKLFQNEKFEKKITCTAKAGKNYSYVPLLILYKAILKEEYFTVDFLKKEFSTKFLFRKNNPNTGITSDCETNHDSLRQAFKKIDRSLAIHEELFLKLKELLN